MPELPSRRSGGPGTRACTRAVPATTPRAGSPTRPAGGRAGRGPVGSTAPARCSTSAADRVVDAAARAVRRAGDRCRRGPRHARRGRRGSPAPRRDRNVSWRHLRAEQLPADLRPVRLVTLAQSFHWMDRPRVAAILRRHARARRRPRPRQRHHPLGCGRRARRPTAHRRGRQSRPGRRLSRPRPPGRPGIRPSGPSTTTRTRSTAPPGSTDPGGSTCRTGRSNAESCRSCAAVHSLSCGGPAPVRRPAGGLRRRAARTCSGQPANRRVPRDDAADRARHLALSGPLSDVAGLARCA